MKTLNGAHISGMIVLAVGLMGTALAQGPLVPPSGPIEPTGRSLEDVQPRNVINELPFVIEQSGAYIVTKTLHLKEGQVGITIGPDADQVDIDLGGFSLVGPGNGQTVGLLLPAVQKAREAAARMECRNGSIIGFGVGIRVEDPTATAGEDYIKITMTDILISSYQTGGSGAQFLFGDGSVRLFNTSIIGCGGDGVQSTPKLQEAIADGCHFSDNGGNGWHLLLPAVQAGAALEAGGGLGSGKVNFQDFHFTKFNNNGLNGFAVSGATASSGDIVPTDQMSLNFSKVEFVGNGQHGFSWQPTAQMNSVPMEEIALNYEEIKFEKNGQNGLHIVDELFPENRPGVSVELNNFRAVNNGSNGILIGLLLPAIQKAALNETEIAAGTGGGPHVKVFNGTMLNNAHNGASITGVASLDSFHTTSANNGYLAWELKQCRVTSYSVSGATGNGLGGFKLEDVHTARFHEVNADGNGGDGVHMAKGHELICRKAGANNNAGHGIWTDTAIVLMSDCSLTSNTKSGASHISMKGSKILQNLYSDNGEQGLMIADGTSNTIMVCETHNNAMAGMELMRSNNNAIHGNTFLGNGAGLKIGGSGNFVYQNIFGSATVHQIDAGNEVAPVGTLGGSTNPWANIVKQSQIPTAK